MLRKKDFLFLSCFSACLAANALAAPVARGAPVCLPDRSVCLEGKAAGDHMDFWLETESPCSLTITLEQESSNLDAEATGRRIFLAERKEKRKLFVSRVLRRGVPWSQKFRFSAQCGRSDAVPDDTYRYLSPVRAQKGAYISQGFHGIQSHHDAANQYATDFAVPVNTPVYAARAGTVVFVEDGYSRGGPGVSVEEVNAVRIEHRDGTVAEYAHLHQGGAAVQKGEEVGAGQLIGYSGNTGRTTGPHLHFAVHVPLDGEFRKSVPIHFASEQMPPTGRSLASFHP